jgi:hypothetical protein
MEWIQLYMFLFSINLWISLLRVINNQVDLTSGTRVVTVRPISGSSGVHDARTGYADITTANNVVLKRTHRTIIYLYRHVYCMLIT